MSFSHLHIHNHIGSRLDAIASPEGYIKKAVELNHPYLAITDHGRLNGIYEHYMKCIEYGIKPIIGIEMYVYDDLIVEEKGKRKRTKTWHIILLVKNKEGYKNLLYLNYLSMKDSEHFYYVPRITTKELFEHSEGLIVGTACMANPFAYHLFQKQPDRGKELFEEYVNVFKEDFFVEIQLNEIPEQKLVNKYMMLLADKYSIPKVITGDVHYLEKGQNELQTLAIAIRDKATIDNITFELESKNLYYHDVDDYIEFNDAFQFNYKKSDILQWCDNTEYITNKIDFRFPKRRRMFIPKMSEDDDETLIKKAKEGLIERLNVKSYSEVPTEYKRRLKKELATIIRKGMSSYLLLIEDIVQFAIKNNIYGMVGRGCFTPETKVFTTNGYKNIENINVGDVILNENGEFDTVINKFSYNIEEKLIQIGNGHLTKYFNYYSTTDHKYLIKRQKDISFIEAKNIRIGDYLCLPKISYIEHNIDTIDLNDFNIFGFDYDDEYIYEKIPTNKSFKYSIRDISRKIGVARETVKRYINNGNTTEKSRNKIFQYCKMDENSLREHIEINKFIVKKVKRFLKVDKLFNIIVGLMAGDGYIKKDNYISLAINSETKVKNKEYFLKFAERILSNDFTYVNKSKTRKLEQIYIYSKVLVNFFLKEVIIYDKHNKKRINNKWLKQKKEYLHYIYLGLILSDGSRDKKNDRLSFDNNSKYLIQNMIEILLKIGKVFSLVKREKFFRDKYLCNPSYKLRIFNPDKEDNKYIYLRVSRIKKINKTKTKVYDLEIKNKSSFLINNFIVHNSVSGSLIAYALKIHNLDPLKYNLIFERFLAAERSPDIVVDYFGDEDDL